MNDRGPMRIVQKVSFLCCQYCSYKTKFTGNLAKHIRTHTGERPFECQFCGKRFASKSNYNTHVIIHSPGGSSSSLRLSPSTRGRFRRNPLCRQLAPDFGLIQKSLVNSGGRSSRQQLSPIGSFLAPDGVNPGMSHTALYSSINYPSYGGSGSLTNINELLPEGAALSKTDDPEPPSGETNHAENSSGVLEVTDPDEDLSPGQQEDVKPSISEILNIIQYANKKISIQRTRERSSRASIKMEAVEEASSFVETVGIGQTGHRRKRTASSAQTRVNESNADSTNGDSGRTARVGGAPFSEDDRNQTHTEMLLDTLIKESRLFRCDPCRALFQEYSLYVLHMGCHGNESAFQCHFCRQVFDDRFGFTAHFIRCPHDQQGFD